MRRRKSNLHAMFSLKRSPVLSRILLMARRTQNIRTKVPQMMMLAICRQTWKRHPQLLPPCSKIRYDFVTLEKPLKSVFSTFLNYGEVDLPQIFRNYENYYKKPFSPTHLSWYSSGVQLGIYMSPTASMAPISSGLFSWVKISRGLKINWLTNTQIAKRPTLEHLGPKYGYTKCPIFSEGEMGNKHLWWKR